MKIQDILKESIELMEKNSISNPFFESRELIAHVLEKSKEWVSAHLDYEVDNNTYSDFRSLVNRRINGEPFQYILGKQGFMGNEFIVNSDVLIPRADTENLVYEVVKIARDISAKSILDMCTGTGCIAISLAKELNVDDFFASDISSKALKIAEENMILNNVNINFVQSNLFENIPKSKKFDIIVSNPPYIPTADIEFLSKDVKNEPNVALDGGEDGLKFYKEIISNAKDFLSDNGILALEIGYNQATKVSEIFCENLYKQIRVVKDYSNNDRVVIGCKGDREYE